MSNVFTSIKPLKPRFSNFNLTYDHKTTSYFGQLIPISYIECLPGDVVKYQPQCIVRLQPTVAPILHKMEVRFESFFVPNRIIDENWVNFITGGKDGEYLDPPPKVNWGNSESGYNTELVDSSNNFKKGSLWDYFGLPCSIQGGQTITPAILDAKNIFVSDLPFRAYNKVYNQYYRDENIESEEINLSSYVVQNRYWTKNDYFSSALPFVLRGVVPSITGNFTDVGLTGSATFSSVFSGSNLTFSDLSNEPTSRTSMITNYDLSLGKGSTNSNPDQFYFNRGANASGNYEAMGTTADRKLRVFEGYSAEDPPANMYYRDIRPNGSVSTSGDFSGMKAKTSDLAFSINSNDIRWLMQAQKFMERQARGGVRYNEFIMNNFSVASGDYRIDRAEFVQSSRSPIIISEIPQTSATTSDSPQGNLAGKGLSASVSPRVRYRAHEYGIFITFVSIVPKLSYVPQGIGKEWRRNDKYNYFFPQFAHMSEQRIENSELYVDTNTDDTNAFGYTGIYNEYRHRRDIVTGDFRDKLDYWHLARKFSSQPALNTDFLKISSTELNRVFAVQDEPTFLIDCMNMYSVFRPIPKFAEPGLVDHF